MSEDLKHDVMRLRQAGESLNAIIVAVVQATDLENPRMAIRDALSGSPAFTDYMNKLGFADKMIQDYTSWLKDIVINLNDLASKLENAGNGPFG